MSPSIPEGVTIRPVEATDARALYEVAMAPAVRRFTVRSASDRFETFQQRIETITPGHHIFVAEVDGRAVAVAGVMQFTRPALAHGAQFFIEVHERYHRRGIGRALMGAVMDFADRDLGLRRVELHVHATNAGAIALYESMGFEREGRLRGNILVDGEYQDSLAMARLNPRVK